MGIENVSLGQRFNAFATRVGASGDSARNQQFDVLGSEWQALYNKPNKTQDDLKKIYAMYQQGFIDFGKSYIDFLDKKFGNGDGILKIDEFKKSQLAPLSDKDKKNQQYVQATENTFKNVDLNEDEKLDAKEMTALLALFDQDYETMTINGKIKAYDMTMLSVDLTEKPGTFYAKNAKADLKEVYNSIFSK